MNGYVKIYHVFTHHEKIMCNNPAVINVHMHIHKHSTSLIC